ncbi:ABC transporter transmembrane domain-containing protein [Vibrio parahaemolyticus]|uniref:ABC transporter transmembrane domain-containing protein n=1 Tax=Vibrio parahaemolyticus TaxID=670 RepID=UPI00111F6897|nr:ABC transporter transmembrane domain-containing protein [Vibrio parahaemolyticus]EGR3362301.1 multidrug resistance-like ATP-binding protein MdlB [Vibrio parahaemolyticus]EJG1667460.1 ATP-binding cassette domain-containing protein [Vibrio parahaemolyticus]EJG1774019.1 ATP-binding cassette domain-containing protein [Vibrio parahaemolyticus]TOJ25109.1 multidrug resistance-like ATP-binding protein MdlB [Vibrio parahaemolyticus]TOJ59558.1 multidrug resistance-like ATP-binding protein MdlB [Vibri
MKQTSTFKRLLSYPLSQPKPMIKGLALLFIAALASASGPWLIQYFIDEHIAKGDYSRNVLIALALGYVSLQVISATFQYLQSLQFSMVATNTIKIIRKQVFSGVIKQPLSAFDYTPAGKLVSRITNDTESLQQFYELLIATVVKNVVMIVVMLGVMFFMSWKLTLVVLVLLPIVIGFMYLFKQLSTESYRRMRDLLTDINANLSESIQGMSVIQLMQQEERFNKQFNELTAEHLVASKKVIRLNGYLLRPLMDLLAGLALLCLVAIFGFNGVELIGVGVLYAFISYLARVTEPLIEMTQQLALLQQALVSSERVFELIDTKPQTYGDDHKPLKTGSIELSNLTFSYDGKQDVLKDISLKAAHQDFIALVGHTGSGKSTLASLLMGFYPTNVGELLIDGRPLNTLGKDVLRKDVAMVQQDPHILPASVRENISLSRVVSDEQIWDALDKVGLSEQIHRYPNGLDTQLGQGETNLSAGQKQLLALARVLVAKPKILILDEATANIDSGTEALIQKSLKVLRQNMTLVVIAHRLSTILDADQIVVLHHGDLVEQGTHKALLQQNGRYAQMYQLQQANRHLQQIEQEDAKQLEEAV